MMLPRAEAVAGASGKWKEKGGVSFESIEAEGEPSTRAVGGSKRSTQRLLTIELQITLDLN
jgi:hypothetical protein